MSNKNPNGKFIEQDGLAEQVSDVVINENEKTTEIGTEKKKRGRPRKVRENVDINEDTKQIVMSQQLMKDKLNDPKNEVGKVKESNISYSQEVTLDALQVRWKSLFSKFGSLQFDTIINTWNNNYGTILNDPFLQNQRIKKANAPATKVSKEELQEAMSNPENNEETLTSVSMYLYYTNYVYHNLILLNRDVPRFSYYAIPQYVDKEEMSKEAFKKESQKVDKILKKFDPVLTFKNITTQLSQQGKCSYLVRTSFDDKDVDFFLLQKLNNNMVKLTNFGSKQNFIASFNMALFLEPAYNVNQYPKFIRDAWDEMNVLGIVREDKKKGKLVLKPKAELPQGHSIEWNEDKYMYWVRLPQSLCWTFYTDGSHPMCFPDTLGLFTDLNDLGDYKWLQANLLSKGINSILTAEVPLTKDPKPGADMTAISPDTILGFQDLFTSSISANIFPFFAPLNEKNTNKNGDCQYFNVNAHREVSEK